MYQQLIAITQQKDLLSTKKIVQQAEQISTYLQGFIKKNERASEVIELMTSINTFLTLLYQHLSTEDPQGKEINSFILEDAMEKLSIHIFEKLIKKLQRNCQQLDSYIIVIIQSNELKITILTSLLPKIIYFDKNDLFSLPRYDPEWCNLYKNLQFKKVGIPMEVNKKLKVLQNNLYLANAMCYEIYDIESNAYRQFLAFVKTIQYFIDRKKAKHLTQQLHLIPNPKAAALVWNIVDELYLWKGVIGQLMQKIAFHQLIYVQGSSYPTLSRKTIYQEIHSGEIYQQYSNIQLTKNTQRENIFEEKPEKIQLRIVSPIPLKSKSEFQRKSWFSYFNNSQKNNETINKIIIHIHGGGWVSMQSYSHQLYTRQWANQLKDVPIFSIDYRKLPEAKYPEAIQDCFQAYCWLIFNIEDYYNIKPEQVILVGDSAGGNMALSICILAQKYNIKVPDGIMLAYPALNLSMQLYTPSYLNCLYDPVVPYQFLNTCISQYVDEGLDPHIDPFLSPFLYPDNILKQLPKMRIIVGENDVLCDDTIRFYQKLVHSGHDNCKVIVYSQMRHGFLNWDLPVLFDASRACIVEAAQLIKELID